MSLYDPLGDLVVEIDDCELHRRERETTAFTRVTTEIRLHGDEHTGYGEDVTYETALHDALQETGPPPLTGEYDHRTFSEVVGDIDLFPGNAPDRDAFRQYRRWGFESAALDLALKQHDSNLADALDESYDPVRFVVSPKLGDPPSAGAVEEWLAIDDGLEFKLDPTSDWTPTLARTLSETESVRVLDLKGHYHGTEVDQPPDSELYELVLETFPDAIVEDPAVTDETATILEGAFDRLSWDAPVHSVEDLNALPETGWLNVKPSRFGSIEELLAAIEVTEDREIERYVGGQFELGPGREHLHALASLFSPTAPNDVAPVSYNDPEPRSGLPTSPLAPPANPTGLEWS